MSDDFIDSIRSQYSESLEKLAIDLTESELSIKSKDIESILSEALMDFFKKTGPSISSIYESIEKTLILCEKYNEAGMPYGESSEGIKRWISEQIKMQEAENGR